MDIIIERYSFPDGLDIKGTITESPFGQLFETLENHKNKIDDNIFVVNLNYDIIFEKSLFCWESKNGGNTLEELDDLKWPLFFVKDSDDFIIHKKCNGKKILLCKPHGGFNLNHDSIKSIIDIPTNPYIGFSKNSFRHDYSNINEPYLIPYFSKPDEFTMEHNMLFSRVGNYFSAQKEILEKMLKEATHALSIGYSFPEEDIHLFDKNTSEKSFVLYDINYCKDEDKDKRDIYKKEQDGRIKKIFPNIKEPEPDINLDGFKSESVAEFSKILIESS